MSTASATYKQHDSPLFTGRWTDYYGEREENCYWLPRIERKRKIYNRWPWSNYTEIVLRWYRKKVSVFALCWVPIIDLFFCPILGKFLRLSSIRVYTSCAHWESKELVWRSYILIQVYLGFRNTIFLKLIISLDYFKIWSVRISRAQCFV